MRVLILGCGYVGSILAERMEREGHEVTGVVRTPESAVLLGEKCSFVRIADVSTESGAREACGGVWDGVVLSVAARGGDFRRSYGDSMRNVLLALHTKPPGCFVYTGSTSVYAQTDGGWVTEESETAPAYDNGRILLETEQVLARGCEGRFPGIILRLSGIYGPDRLHMLDQIRGGATSFSGDGGQWKNQIHRDDAAGAAAYALSHFRAKTFGPHIFNVSDNEPVSRFDYTAWLCQRLNRQEPVFNNEQISDRRGRGEFKNHRRISNRKLRDAGWAPSYPTFREGLKSEVAE